MEEAEPAGMRCSMAMAREEAKVENDRFDLPGLLRPRPAASGGVAHRL